MTTLEACRAALPMLTWSNPNGEGFGVFGAVGDGALEDASFYAGVYDDLSNDLPADRVVFDGCLNPFRQSTEHTLYGETLDERIAHLVELVADAKDEARTEADAWLAVAKGLKA